MTAKFAEFVASVTIYYDNLALSPISRRSRLMPHYHEVLKCEKDSNRLVPGPNYVTDALKLPNQAPKGSGQSLQKCVDWRCPYGTQHFFCWPILVNRLASNDPLVHSIDLNFVFGYAETSNKGFLSVSPNTQ
ncbi:hypothetical protein TNCV_2815461 [Trichonephila clavipes]|nr:hypothetical protein TNCV_2815461 [Trichonephila clavipes]